MNRGIPLAAMGLLICGVVAEVPAYSAWHWPFGRVSSSGVAMCGVITKPTNGQKLCGSPEGCRETLKFYLELEVAIYPAAARNGISDVKFHYTKGSSGNIGEIGTTWHHDAGDWCYYTARLDITQRYTTSWQSQTEGRYQVCALWTYQGNTLRTGSDRSPNNPRFIIIKGAQIWYALTHNRGPGWTQEMNEQRDCWLHYPYHWGGKGPDYFDPNATAPDPSAYHGPGYCPGVLGGHPRPADDYVVHYPYDNDHPQDDDHHFCCFDCSGLAWYVYHYLGIKRNNAEIPQGTAADQHETLVNWGWSLNVNQAKPGDLLSYDHHVAIASAGVVSGSPDRVHAPRSGLWTRGEDGLNSPVAAAGPSGEGWEMWY